MHVVAVLSIMSRATMIAVWPTMKKMIVLPAMLLPAKSVHSVKMNRW